LVISAERVLIIMIRSLTLLKDRYSSRKTSAARGLSAPIIILSGRIKSSMAAPSFKNSGLDTTSKSISTPLSCNISLTVFLTKSAVPTGTVDLSTIIL